LDIKANAKGGQKGVGTIEWGNVPPKKSGESVSSPRYALVGGKCPGRKKADLSA